MAIISSSDRHMKSRLFGSFMRFVAAFNMRSWILRLCRAIKLRDKIAGVTSVSSLENRLETNKTSAHAYNRCVQMNKGLFIPDLFFLNLSLTSGAIDIQSCVERTSKRRHNPLCFLLKPRIRSRETCNFFSSLETKRAQQ